MSEAYENIADYYQELEEIAVGWFHWPPEVAMAADVNTIAIGFKGHMNMLYRIFGKKTPDTGTSGKPRRGGGGRPLVLTPKVFDTLFGTGKQPNRRRRQ